MATIRRHTPSQEPDAPAPEPKTSRLEALKARKAELSSLTLATEFSTPETDLTRLSWLLYGEMKIGKTSLASMFPDCGFMMFEPGGRGLAIRKNEIDTWDQFKVYLPQILKSNLKVVVIDTADVAYDKCFKHVCKRMSVEHPSQGNYGDVWKAIEQEFVDTMSTIIQSGRGIIFTSHTETKTFSKRTGGEYDKIIPSMTKQAREFMKAISDVIAYYGYYGNERFLTVTGSDELDAGHRLKYQFWVKDQYEEFTDALGRPLYRGTRVHSIPMGVDEFEGYANLERAFNNLQDSDGDPGRKAKLSEQAPPSKSRR